MRNITRHELYYRYNFVTKSWDLKEVESTNIDSRKLWLDDIMSFYNSNYHRPLVAGYNNLTYNNQRIIGVCGFIGSIAQNIVIYTEV